MNSILTKDQTTGVVERIIYGLAMGVLAKLVAKGYIDQDMAAYVAGGVVMAVGGIWGWWVNRPKALAIAAAASLPAGSMIVTSKEMAAATPDQANIVSSTENKVVPK